MNRNAKRNTDQHRESYSSKTSKERTIKNDNGINEEDNESENTETVQNGSQQRERKIDRTNDTIKRGSSSNIKPRGINLDVNDLFQQLDPDLATKFKIFMQDVLSRNVLLAQSNQLSNDPNTVQTQQTTALDAAIGLDTHTDYLTFSTTIDDLKRELEQERINEKPTALVSLFDSVYVNELTPIKEYEIITEISPYIQYEFEHSESYRLMPDKQLVESIDYLASKTLEMYRYGTSIVRFTPNERILSIMNNKDDILFKSGTTGYSIQVHASKLAEIAILFANDNTILTMEQVALKPYSTYIMQKVPVQKFVSPLFLSTLSVDPSWFIRAIENLLSSGQAAFGRISSTLSDMNVTTHYDMAIPIDQYTANLLNYNCRRALTIINNDDSIKAFIQAHIRASDIIDLNAHAYLNIPELTDSKLLGMIVLALATNNDIGKAMRAINLQYLSEAKTFSINSNSKLQELLNNSATIENSILNFFTSRIGSTSPDTILNMLALEQSIIQHSLRIIPPDVTITTPAYLLVILEYVLCYRLFPNLMTHALWDIQHRVLLFMANNNHIEYRTFLQNFGYYYTMSGAIKNYIVEPNTHTMMERKNVYNSKYYLSMFSRDPHMMSLCPTIAKIANLFILDNQPTEDTQAIAANFPRFKDRSYHFIPTNRITYQDSFFMSGTATSLKYIIKTMFELMKTLKPDDLKRGITSAGLSTILNTLLPLCDDVGYFMDGHIDILWRIMANFPFNCIPSTNGDISTFRGIRYALVSDTKTYPIYSDLESGDDVRTIDTRVIWTIFGNLRSTFCERLLPGSSRAGVTMEHDPIIPDAMPIISQELSLIQYIRKLASVDGLCSMLMSKKAIPGYNLSAIYDGILFNDDSAFVQLRERIITKFHERIDSRLQVYVNKNYYKQSAKILNPQIRRVIDGVIQSFSETIDNAIFERDAIYIEESILDRFKIGIDYINSPLFWVYKGIIIYKQRVPRYNPAERISLDQEMNAPLHIEVNNNMLRQHTIEGRTTYVVEINGTNYDDPHHYPKTVFTVNNPRILHSHLWNLLCSSVTHGNCAIVLPNLKYIPRITSKTYDQGISAEEIWYATEDRVFNIHFYSNMTDPDDSPTHLPSRSITYKLFHPITDITNTLSATSLIERNMTKPVDAIIPRATELTLGTIDDATWQVLYPDRIEKRLVTQISMLNVVRIINGPLAIPDPKVTYSVTHTESIMPLASASVIR